MDDRRCGRCGYALKGLREDAKCPECGRAIRQRKQVRGSADLTHAPVAWLRALSSSAHFALAGWTGLIGVWVALTIFVRPDKPVVWTILFLPAVLYVWGVLGLTRPRPLMAGTQVPPEREWWRMRLATRLASLGWIITVTAFLTRAMSNPPASIETLLEIAGFVGLLAGIVGQVLLFLYLGNIADWGNDLNLVFKLRGAAWAVGVGAVAMLLLQLAVSGGVGLVEGIVIAGGTLVLLASVLISVATFWRVAGMASWAIINHMTDRARSERLREKAERSRLRDAPAGPPPPQAVERGPSTSRSTASTPVRPAPSSSAQAPAKSSRPPSVEKPATAGGASSDDGIYMLAPEDEPPVPPR